MECSKHLDFIFDEREAKIIYDILLVYCQTTHIPKDEDIRDKENMRDEIGKYLEESRLYG